MEDNTRRTSVREVLGDVDVGETSTNKPGKKDLHNAGMAQKKNMKEWIKYFATHKKKSRK